MAAAQARACLRVLELAPGTVHDAVPELLACHLLELRLRDQPLQAPAHTTQDLEPVGGSLRT